MYQWGAVTRSLVTFKQVSHTGSFTNIVKSCNKVNIKEKLLRMIKKRRKAPLSHNSQLPLPTIARIITIK